MATVLVGAVAVALVVGSAWRDRGGEATGIRDAAVAVVEPLPAGSAPSRTPPPAEATSAPASVPARADAAPAAPPLAGAPQDAAPDAAPDAPSGGWPAGFRPVVALDAGHGGADPGAVGATGLLEKNVTLDLARLVAAGLAATGRYAPFLIRDDDSYVRLEERVSRARDAGAEVFISLHADANTNPSVSGATVYTISPRGADAAASRFVERGPGPTRIAGVMLEEADSTTASLLVDLARRVALRDADTLAEMVVEELAAETVLVNNSRRLGGFVVLMAPDVPSVLIEVGMMSNAADEARLSDPEHLADLAEAIVRATERYFRWVIENGGA